MVKITHAMLLAFCFSTVMRASIIDDAKKHADFKVTKENAQGEGRLHLQMIDIMRKALTESVDCLKKAYRDKREEIYKADSLNHCDATTESCEKIVESIKNMNEQAKDLLIKLQFEYKALKTVEGFYKKYNEKLMPYSEVVAPVVTANQES